MESNNSDKFDVADAKEWWYGTFVKSSEYLGAVSSPSKKDNGEVASRKRLLATSVATNKKLPSWKGGKSFAIGRLKFVELPLVMSHRVLYLPTKPGETDAHRLKVAENSLQKLIIVQKTDGRYFTRIVTIIPSLDYLSKMQFNLREFSLEHIPADFEGIINVSDWNESQVANWLYKEGKRKRVKIEIREPNERGRKKLLREIPCPPEYGIVDYHKYCIDVWGSDDEPSNYCDDPANWQIGTPIYGYYVPDGPCFEEDNTGDPCSNLTPEQCACLTYGIGCDDGGGGNGYGDWDDGVSHNYICNYLDSRQLGSAFTGQLGGLAASFRNNGTGFIVTAGFAEDACFTIPTISATTASTLFQNAWAAAVAGVTSDLESGMVQPTPTSIKVRLQQRIINQLPPGSAFTNGPCFGSVPRTVVHYCPNP